MLSSGSLRLPLNPSTNPCNILGANPTVRVLEPKSTLEVRDLGDVMTEKEENVAVSVHHNSLQLNSTEFKISVLIGEFLGV